MTSGLLRPQPHCNTNVVAVQRERVARCRRTSPARAIGLFLPLECVESLPGYAMAAARFTTVLHREDLAVGGYPLAKLRDVCRPRQVRARRPKRIVVRAGLEFLEDRITPTGNITVTNAFVVDGSGQPLASINVGAFVSVQAEFTTLDLPADASYVVSYTVNGLTRSTGTLTWAPESRERAPTSTTGVASLPHPVLTRSRSPSILSNPCRRRVTPTTP